MKYALPAALLLAASAALGAPPAPPATAKVPVTDDLHDVKIVDDYRWLEDWSKADVKAWSESQNAYARSVLDALPDVTPIRERITALLSGTSDSFDHMESAGSMLFALKHEPKKQQPILVTLPSLDDPAKARAIVDPNTIDPTGHTAIDWFVPSHDGSMVAVSMSEGGSESGTVHVFKTAGGGGGAKIADVIPRVQGGTAGGSLAWDEDGKGFYYTRYPHKGERPDEDLDFYMQVYHHTLGTDSAKDTYELGKDFPKIAEIVLESRGGHILASVQDGDGGIFMHWVRDTQLVGGTPWKQATKWEDKVVLAKLGPKGTLYMVNRKDAPRGKVVLRDLSTNSDKTIVPQDSRNSIETAFDVGKGLTITNNALYVLYQAGGPNELRAFDLVGKAKGSISLPPVSAVDEMMASGDDVYLNVESFIQPPAWYVMGPADSGAMTATGLKMTSPADFSGCIVQRTFAKSKDGTMVPLNIISRSDVKLDGNNPTIIWGYGGYGVNQAPAFSPRRALWVEQGGIFVVANIRGGGEYGEEWHLNGNLTKKQNVFDDYHAACRLMIDNKYTSPAKLALMGGSNGGLLMGAEFTQHPDVAKAVVSMVGIYDMLRVELSSNGAFNVTEFGTVKDKAQFDALYAYSPYHHVKDGVKYPSILFMTGANDPRVDPMQSRKMTARLQAASPGSLTLLRTDPNSGHGIGSSLSARIEEYTDMYAFLFNELGVKYTPRK